MHRNPKKETAERRPSKARSLVDSGVSLIVAVAFLVFSLLIYLPATIFFSNLNEFSLRLRDFVLIFGSAAIVSALFAFVVIRVCRGAARTYLLSLAFAIGILFWLQGNILVWRYGPFDGSEINWSAYWLNGLIDSVIWLAVLALGLRFPIRMVSFGRNAAIAVIAIQTAMLASSALTVEPDAEEDSIRNYAIDESHKYSFSDNLNVIFVVLDAFQADVFDEIVSNDDDYGEIFPGFSYFPDAVAGSNYTELAIPALLTGKMYDNSIPREQFLRDSFLNHGITTILRRSQFVVDIYPWVGWGNESIYFTEAVASNLVKIDRREVAEPTFTEKKAKEALQLLDLSVFRAVPHFAKKHVYNDHKWFFSYLATYMVPESVKQVVSTDNKFEAHTFVRNAPEVLPTDRGEKVMKYFHLKGAHSPLTVNPSLEFTADTFSFTRDNYIHQAKANLLWLDRFFDKLRAAGIYDSSLILVLGDHGSGESPEMYVVPPGGDRKPYSMDGTDRNFRRDKARALALVLIKRRFSTGQLEKLETPVSLLDVPTTVLVELGMQKTQDRPSVFELSEAQERTRYHSAFEFGPNKTSYVDDISVYAINGNSWFDEAWTLHGIRPAQRLEN